MLTMRGGPQVGAPGVKMGRPPPVPPRPDKTLVADALAKSRKVPAPVLPPNLKKDTSEPESPKTDNPPSPSVDKSPSPKLNGLSRVKSFIRDVIHDKKHSEDKKAAKDGVDPNSKNGSIKSHIPISQQILKTKQKVSLNRPSEESVKNQSSQSVVRSLCSVLTNSDKNATPQPNVVTKERVKIIKSNSFAEKPVPVRRAPPPPISPKPSKKVIEERLARSQNPHFENVSMRKLSASCEELNGPVPRPVVYQSPTPNKPSSPISAKKSLPPNLPPGKPSLPKKRNDSGSPVTPVAALNAFSLCEMKVEELPAKKDGDDLEFYDKDDKQATEMLISEIIAAKNETLLSQISSSKTEISVNNANIEAENNAVMQSSVNGSLVNGMNNASPDDSIVSCNSYGSTPPKRSHDSVSVCGSDGSSGAGKTILFINSENFSEKYRESSKDRILNGEIKLDEKHAGSTKHLDDIANHELLIYELQKMECEDRNRRRKPSSEIGLSSSPDSISAETQNIQHSDWVQVDDNGDKVRYSSCQIMIEDTLPVDDSGICLNENFYTAENLSLCLSPSLVSRLREQLYTCQKMSSLQGLPPLPKSLSGFNVGDGENPPPVPPGPVPPPVPARGPNSLRYAAGSPASPTTPGSVGGITVNGASSSSSDTHRHSRKATTLDAQLALLKREMLSLRQLDLSLLSQLWSLNESIHEFRQYMSERSNCSGVPEDDDDMEDEGDDSSSGGEDVPQPHPHALRGRTPV